MPKCHDYKLLDSQLEAPLDSGEGNAEIDWLPVNDDETLEPPMFSSIDGPDSYLTQFGRHGRDDDSKS